MKIRNKTLLTSVFLLPFSAFLGLGARVLSLHLFALLFKVWNLTEATFAYAPVRIQRLAGLTGSISDLCFLIFFSIPLVLYTKNLRMRFRKKHLVFAASGVLLSILTVGVFLIAGSARMPKRIVLPGLSAFLTTALTDFFSVFALAHLARKAPRKMFEKNQPVRLILSILLEAVFWVVSQKSLSPVFLLNACLSGFLLFILLNRTDSILPEILLLFSFRFFTRFIFGFPDLGGAYPVSEPLLTGGAGGVSHSVLLSFYLVILAVYAFFRMYKFRKGDSHVSP